MQKIIGIFCEAIAIGGLCLGLSGCTKEADGLRGDGQVVLMQMSVDSRAVSEVDGTPSAEEAALHSLRAYAFVGGQPAGHFYYKGTGITASYNFLMDITMYSTTMQVIDFYVVANEAAMATPGDQKALTESTTEAELKNFFFTELVAGEGLPMYSHQQIKVYMDSDADNNPQTVTGHEGHTLLAQKVELELARPVGKLGVFAAKTAGESGVLKITGLTLHKEGLRLINYLMPQTDETLKAVGSRDQSQTLSVVADAVTAELAADITDEQRRNPANYDAVMAAPFYLFENPYGSSAWNTPGDANGNVLQIDFEFDGVARTGMVYLPRIDRNHYYAVCCLMNNSGKITVEYSVADWDDAPAWNDMVFDYPTYTNPLMPASGATELFNPTVYYNPDAGSSAGTFSVTFSMTAPSGQTWQPTLIDASPADFEVKVYQGGQEVASPVASAEPYTITVRALKSENVGKTCTLGISYIPSWDPGKSEMLLINGAVGDIKWPGSGSDPLYIEIEQVEPQTVNP